MKIIDKPKWHVSDVIRFGNGDSKGIALIVKIASRKYSTVTLLGAFPGYVGAPKNKVWRKGAFYPTIRDLENNYLKMYEYARVVPFYGTVGSFEDHDVEITDDETAED